MMRKFLWLSCLIIVAVVPIIARAQFDIDYAAFQYDSTDVYWEIYYTIPRSRLTYIAEKTAGFYALVVLRMKLVQNEAPWKVLSWKFQDVLPDTTRSQRTMKIVDRVQVLAPPGKYKATLCIQDLNNSAYMDSVSFSANISGFPSDNIGMSDIELASSIEKKSRDKKNPFYKNSLLVIPNPGRIFGELLPVLNFYVETYNLLKNIPGKSYEIHYKVLGSDGRQREEKSEVRQKKVDTRVEIGSISLKSFPIGTYFFHFAITDSTGKELVSKKAKFYIYNKTQAQRSNFAGMDESELVQKSEFGNMTESDLDRELDYAHYFCKAEDKQIYKSLEDLQSKRLFIYSLWHKRDTSPETPLNEFRQEYMRRIRYANEKFSAFKKKGWKTDQGRVIILYGEPSYIERNPSTEGYRPYMIWTYDEIQGGVLFVFADLSGFRDYTLLHSTALGELQYPEYMKRIRQGF